MNKIKTILKYWWFSIKTFVNLNNDYFFLALGVFAGKTVEGKLWEGVLLGAISAFVLFIIRKTFRKPTNK
jgi:hypothetical protein